ncbi:MAG: peptide ABC transporter substrate-binding protein [Pseudomonadales bacterium]|nr:peptide ABC transporter substrate-binding protein [Pseudomonadales bacterium]
MLRRLCIAAMMLAASWHLPALAAGVDPANNSITISLTQEPPNLDSSISEDTTSSQILRLTNEALVSVDRRGDPIPAVAESWEQSPTQVTFHLRADAKWADGVPVKAADFVYAWRRLVDPETAARGSTFYANAIKNAQAIIEGKMPPESLGVHAADDRTLVVELSRPVPFILSVLSGTAYMPLRQDFVEAQQGRYGADAAHLLSNGPFKLDKWVHNASMVLTKNDEYWDRDNVKLDQIDVGYITSDQRSLLNLYKSGDLAALRLEEDILADASRAGFRINKAPTNCVAWILLNLAEDRPTSNKKLRYAIRHALDRDAYINNIVGLPGTLRTDTVFSNRIRGVKRAFDKEYPAPEITLDVPEARRLLEEARQELGVDEIPPLVLLANETRQIDAEYFQSQLKVALGLDVRVDKQTFKQAIAKMQAGDFDIARAAFCGGSILDPVFFAGIFESSSPFNLGAFENAEYDRLYAITNQTADQQVRMDAFGQMQQILFDEAPVIPTHVYSWVYLQDERVKGLERYPLTDFSRGYIDI